MSAMDVIFIEPCFPANQREFPRALAAVGARVIGIGERPKSALGTDLERALAHYEQIGNVCDIDELEKAVRWLQQRAQVQRLEAVVEAHVMSAAVVRERCGIPGTSVHTTWLCRDKPSMKDALRSAGVPCAQTVGSGDRAVLRAFAAQQGYPLIVKPRAGAGASGARRVDRDAELEAALDEAHVGRGGEVAVEEFIEGHEGFYDTLTANGQVLHEFACHYYPNVLEAMRTRWISPQFIATNRIDTAEGYGELKLMGRRVIQALGIGTSATHMEWFAGPRGLKFSEIGCRPPGVRAWDLYAAGNDFDIYREWAMAIVHGRPAQRLSRRYSCGLIALRPEADGVIAGYEGLEQVRARFGGNLIDWHLPDPGTPTQPVEAGYMANAWIRARDPDYDRLRAILNEIGETVKVRVRRG
jgi:carbamoylphosphate synthase large subunit